MARLKKINLKKPQIKEKIKTAFEDAGVAQAVAMRARVDYYQRWMEITAQTHGAPCTDWREIDYSIPQISLEAKICDPRNLKMITSGDGDRFAAEQLTDAERVVWYEFVDEDGTRYTDLEKRNLARDALGALNPLRKRKINKK